jgi:hypothetical protein
VNTTEATARTFEFTGYIVMVLAVMVAMFFSGWVAGFIGRPAATRYLHGILYGLLSWCLALILSFMLVSDISQFMSYQYRSLTNANVASIAMISSPLAENAYNRAETPIRNMIERGQVLRDENVAKTVFLLFLISFAGLLSACFGGYMAIKRYLRGSKYRQQVV